MPAALPRLHMVLSTEPGPALALPPGYCLEPIRSGGEATWAEIWNDAAPERPVSPARFAEVFGHDWAVIAQRCIFLRDENERIVGTVAAWFDPAVNGEAAGRVHWLAVRRAAQGRGLAKALLSHALVYLAAHHRVVRLRTQPDRLAAIRLYLTHGFVPEIVGPADFVHWRSIAQSLGRPLPGVPGHGAPPC